MNPELQEQIPQPEEKKSVSITDAAKINNVTRQAIYVAIKLNKLKAQKDSTRWTIDLNDLEEYRKSKYSRAKSTFDGELIFKPEEGRFSVNQVAEKLGIPPQKVYYATRSGKIKAERKGAAWVISHEEIEAYRASYLLKKKAKKSA
ncbi:MAG: helix-turn-helix domain-containing protein [Chlamydiia bacterium]|nr:helix-turn-helix domain-containing protein [Chlamydiia bacterium]